MARVTASENQRRIDQHSQKIMTHTTEIALLKQVAKNLSPDFFNKIDKMYKTLEEDNGQTSFRTWRIHTDGRIRSLELSEAKERKENIKLKLERKQWLFWGVTTFVSIFAGALINHIFDLIP